MSIAEAFLNELTYEGAGTRKLLERLPEARFGWKPHPKSMTLGRLAAHVSETLEWTGAIVNQPELVWDPAEYTPADFKTVAELLGAYDKNLHSVKDVLKGVHDEQLMALWRFRVKDQVIIEMPKVAVIRSMVINHHIHHRGQLTVYARELDVPLPGLYGPTADEPMPG